MGTINCKPNKDQKTIMFVTTLFRGTRTEEHVRLYTLEETPCHLTPHGSKNRGGDYPCHPPRSLCLTSDGKIITDDTPQSVVDISWNEMYLIESVIGTIGTPFLRLQ